MATDSDVRVRSILLVAYFYPPCTDVGAHRPTALAKYLRRMGHDVTVLTTSAYGGYADDDGEADVVRTKDLRLTRVRVRGRKRIQGAYGADTYSPRPHPLSYITVPDRMVLAWVPFAVRTALSLHRARRFDAVITTSPPESIHLVGRALAATGCAWIADLRDGWTFESWRSFPTRLQQRLDGWMETRLMRAADVVTCVTRPVAEDLEARVQARPTVVPHGFDPELIATAEEDESAADALLDPGRVSIVYTGRFGAYERDQLPLAAALRELATEEPATADRIELVIAGSMRTEERELLEGLAPLRVSLLGAVPHRRALALQRAADVLLLFGSRRAQVANLKLYEYLGAAKPILALAQGTEAGRIVAEAGGLVVPADEPDSIKAAFRRVASAQPSAPDPSQIQQSAYPAPAEQMADAVEVAIRRSRARAGRVPRPTRLYRSRRHRLPATVPAPPELRIRRLDANPVIRPDMLPAGDGGNINGPSLIRAPEWIDRPLSRYYLYFAHHHGDHIRLAYADELSGPWRIHEPGTLNLTDVAGATGHIASPDVHVDNERKQIRMYFHGPARGVRGQRTFVAFSNDGLSFTSRDRILGDSYFRAFSLGDHWYAFARGGQLYRSNNGVSGFRPGPNPFSEHSARHLAVQLEENLVWAYLTRIGDSPERILRCRIDVNRPWTEWSVDAPLEEVLRPEIEYEGANLPVRPSTAGSAPGPQNGLRDPAIFSDSDRTYLVYSVAGESGLAIAELIEPSSNRGTEGSDSSVAAD